MKSKNVLIGAIVAVVVAAGAVLFFAKDSIFGPSGVTVVYEVFGDGLANINYVQDTETKFEQAELPWRKEVTMSIPAFLVSLKASGLNGGGPLSCKANVDGTDFVNSTRPSPQFPLVSCEKKYP